jgi:hypothetical protein
MFRKELKRSISIILTLALIVTSSLIHNTNASAEGLNSKSNFNFISTNPDYTEYTYDEYGNSYKVIEKANDDMTDISTEIYIKENNNYILLENFTTTVEKIQNNIIINTENNGEITQAIIDISSDESQNGVSTINFNEINASTSSLLTDWQFSQRTTGNTVVLNWTLTIVTSVIIALVATSMTGTAGVIAKSAATALARKIIDMAIPILYYSQYIYHKWIKDVNPSFYRGEKVETFFYEDSGHTRYLQTIINEYVDPNWE